ncbi:MAG: hypothetical protein ACYDA6_09010 [Solirubrobacteraceae bacterium]
MPSIGTSIIVIAAGAILRFAVTATVEGVSLQTVGLILIIVGAVGLMLSVLYMFSWGAWRRVDRVAPGQPPPEPIYEDPTRRY